MTAQLHRRRKRWGVLLLALTTGTASLGATQAQGAQEAGVLIHNGFGTARGFVKECRLPSRAATPWVSSTACSLLRCLVPQRTGSSGLSVASHI